MPPRIPDDKREAILADIRAGELHCSQIAAAHHVAKSTVSKLAADFGLSFERSRTKNATEAKRADNAAMRAQIVERLYRRATQWLDQMDEPFLVFSFGGRDNTYNEHLLDAPPTGDIRNLMTSVGIAVQRAAELERFDADAGDKPAVDAWLDAMTGGS